MQPRSIQCLWIVALALLLGGCDNYVVSDKPWFEAKDGGGAEIRAGWWVVKDGDCRFEAEAPSTS
jgi:hypothetical protein